MNSDREKMIEILTELNVGRFSAGFSCDEDRAVIADRFIEAGFKRDNISTPEKYHYHLCEPGKHDIKRESGIGWSREWCTKCSYKATWG